VHRIFALQQATQLILSTPVIPSIQPLTNSRIEIRKEAVFGARISIKRLLISSELL